MGKVTTTAPNGINKRRGKAERGEKASGTDSARDKQRRSCAGAKRERERERERKEREKKEEEKKKKKKKKGKERHQTLPVNILSVSFLNFSA